MPRIGRTTAIVGAQYGSEGKGVVAARIANEYDWHIRIGAPNAGHSFVYKDRLWKMQMVPCGWCNPNAHCLLGRGALINLRVLRAELESILEIDPGFLGRFHIDDQAGILEPRHEEAEGHTSGEIHKRIGSTGEGVGAARADRMSRNSELFRLAKHAEHEEVLPGIELGELLIHNSPHTLAQARLEGKNVLIEGTQGSGLSLIHGPWPFATSTDTNAAQMAADIGIPPHHIDQVILVIRTYPIRVAGNSGPLKDETTWEELSAKIGMEVIERTTVTKKVRRVGKWDPDLVQSAVTLNAPQLAALTFLDYMCPQDTGKTKYADLSNEARSFITYLERMFGLRVVFIGTGWSDESGWVCVDRR